MHTLIGWDRHSNLVFTSSNALSQQPPTRASFSTSSRLRLPSRLDTTAAASDSSQRHCRRLTDCLQVQILRNTKVVQRQGASQIGLRVRARAMGKRGQGRTEIPIELWPRRR